MSEPELPPIDLIRQARAGDRSALGELLDRYRGYLKGVAERELPARLEARADDSDIVQQTCLSVYRNFHQFAGAEEAEFVAWLQQVLQNNIQEFIRNHTQIQKRAVQRERRLEATDESTGGGFQPVSPDPSPSQQASRGEEELRLRRNLARLPPEQQEAVRLRHLEGKSLADIASLMGKSPAAAAGLLKRGLQTLRGLFDADGSRDASAGDH